MLFPCLEKFYLVIKEAKDRDEASLLLSSCLERGIIESRGMLIGKVDD
jgi:hypothetical protein